MPSLKSQSGQSVLEVILVIAVFSTLSLGVIVSFYSSAFASKQALQYGMARGYVKEAVEAVRSIRDQDWDLMTNGTFGLSTAAAKYAFSGASDSLQGGKYTRSVTIADAFRTGSLDGDLAASGTLDENTKKVSVNLSWQLLSGQIKNLVSVFYVMNWSVMSWVQTLVADFTAGSSNGTAIASTGDGESVLGQMNQTWQNLASVGSLDLSGTGDVVAIDFDSGSDILYTLASNTSGDDFTAIDMSNASNGTPTVLRGFAISGATDFVRYGNYAYISADQAGAGAEVVIVDVRTMTQVGSINLSGSIVASSIAISGTKLGIARANSAGTPEVYFYSLSNPIAPTVLGSTEIAESVNDITMNGSYAFVALANDAKEVSVIQLSNYTVLPDVNLSGSDDALSLKISGTDLYVGRANGSTTDFTQLDISDVPGGVSVQNSIELGANVNDIAIDSTESYAVLATSLSTQEVMMINLASMTKISNVDVTGTNSANAVSVFGSMIYLGSAADAAELTAIQTQSNAWKTPVLSSLTNKPSNIDPKKVVVSGDYTYVVTLSDGSNPEFYLYDTSNTASPSLMGTLEIGANVNGIVVSGNAIYLATSDNSRELIVVDVSDKSAPFISESYNTSGSSDMLSIAISGSVLFTGRSQSGSDKEFFVYDVSNPLSVSLTGSIDYASNINDLAVSGNTVYAATSGSSAELQIFSVSNPASPTTLGAFNANGTGTGISVAVNGSVAALGRTSSGNTDLWMIDVSNPSAPVAYGSAEVGASVNSIAFDAADMSGGLFLGTSSTTVGLQRWNISSLSAPALFSSYNLSGNGASVFHNGANVFAASSNNSGELQILSPGSTGMGFAKEGNFTSQMFDTGSATTTYSTMNWTLSGTGSVAFRIRTADSQANLANATWVGVGGSVSVPYTVSGSTITLDPSATGSRWIQYKESETGDGTATPIVEDVSIAYTP